MKEFRWIETKKEKPELDTIVLVEVRVFGIMLLQRKKEQMQHHSSMSDTFNKYFSFNFKVNPDPKYYWTPADLSVRYSEDLIEAWSYIPCRNMTHTMRMEG